MKDLWSGRLLAKGFRKGNLYFISASVGQAHHTRVSSSSSASLRTWHLRLAHASFTTIRSLVSTGSLKVDCNSASPAYSSLQAFGCLCYVHISKSPSVTNWSPSQIGADCCIFLGYSDDHKGFRCFSLCRRRVFISRHVTFDEATLYDLPSTVPRSQRKEIFIQIIIFQKLFSIYLLVCFIFVYNY